MFLGDHYNKWLHHKISSVLIFHRFEGVVKYRDEGTERLFPNGRFWEVPHTWAICGMFASKESHKKPCSSNTKS